MGSEPPGEPAFDHYFSERPRSASHRRELRFLYRGRLLRFEVDAGVFAASGLDPGTALLIENMELATTDRVLDLGCGWGAIGIAAAKSAPEGFVVLSDVNRRATRLAADNVRRNGVRNAEVRTGRFYEALESERFNVVASNPPYHAGRPEILAMLEATPGHLLPGGRLLLVGKGSQGIRFYQDWLTRHWAKSVDVLARGGGYRVLEASTTGRESPSGSVAVRRSEAGAGISRRPARRSA